MMTVWFPFEPKKELGLKKKKTTKKNRKKNPKKQKIYPLYFVCMFILKHLLFKRVLCFNENISKYK